MLDFMIPYDRATPSIGTSMIIRKDNDTEYATYEGTPIGESWMHTKICECSSRRWKPASDEFNCPKCQTIWKKALDNTVDDDIIEVLES
jgi:hypothetical protein